MNVWLIYISWSLKSTPFDLLLTLCPTFTVPPARISILRLDFCFLIPRLRASKIKSTAASLSFKYPRLHWVFVPRHIFLRAVNYILGHDCEAN